MADETEQQGRAVERSVSLRGWTAPSQPPRPKGRGTRAQVPVLAVLRNSALQRGETESGYIHVDARCHLPCLSTFFCLAMQMNVPLTTLSLPSLFIYGVHRLRPFCSDLMAYLPWASGEGVRNCAIATNVFRENTSTYLFCLYR